MKELLDITDGFTTLPNASMRDTFDRSIRHSQDHISKIFFSNSPNSCVLGGRQYSDLRNELASYLMSRSISKVSYKVRARKSLELCSRYKCIVLSPRFNYDVTLHAMEFRKKLSTMQHVCPVKTSFSRIAFLPS